MADEDAVWNRSPVLPDRSRHERWKVIRTDAYKKYHEIQADSSSDAMKKYQNLSAMIFCLLSTVSFEDRFFFSKVPEIIERCAEEDKDFQAEKASKALRQLEGYVLLIARFPWKQEFKTIKLYNGFFRVKVQVHLSKAIDLLTIIGFERKPDDTIQLSSNVNSDMCYKVAFDLFVASVECELLATAFQKLVPMGFLPGDIVKSRRQSQGDVDTLVSYVLKHCKSVSNLPADNSSEYDSFKDAETVASSSQVHHLLTRPRPGRIGIDREIGLPEKVRTDSGYHTEPASSFRPRVPAVSRPARYTPDNYDTPAEFGAPCYHTGTMDDHLNAASMNTDLPRSPSAPLKKPLRPTMSLGNYEQKAGAEWDYVRHGLLQKYGTSYYDGERGDILHPRRRTPIPTHVKDTDFREKVIEPAPKLPPRGESSPKLPPRQIVQSDFTNRLDHDVAYPPPLVSRGTKPSIRQNDQCDGGVALVTDCPLPEPDEAVSSRRSSSDKLFGGPPDTAASKSAMFKTKLQRYEQLGQKLNVPRDTPNYESSSWNCRFCTFRNEPGDTVCGACGKSTRDAPDMNYQTYARICSQCTFENEPGATVCFVCESKLDNFQTVV